LSETANYRERLAKRINYGVTSLSDEGLYGFWKGCRIAGCFISLILCGPRKPLIVVPKVFLIFDDNILIAQKI